MSQPAVLTRLRQLEQEKRIVHSCTRSSRSLDPRIDFLTRKRSRYAHTILPVASIIQRLSIGEPISADCTKARFAIIELLRPREKEM